MQTTNTVKVIANKNGEMITVNANNPEYGFVQVMSEQFIVNSNSWMNKVSRRALIPGAIKVLEESGLKLGQLLPGKIVVREAVGVKGQRSLYGDKVSDEVGLKFRSAAHRERGICYVVGDEAIYQKKVYTLNLDEPDVLVTETNREDIVNFTNAQKAAGNENLIAGYVALKAAPKTGVKK